MTYATHPHAKHKWNEKMKKGRDKKNAMRNTSTCIPAGSQEEDSPEVQADMSK
jgi:hypothetical protein